MALTPKGEPYQLVAFFDPATGNIVIPGTGGGGGGGGGAVTIADGADVALGSTTAAAGDPSAIGQLKAINQTVSSQNPANIVLDPTAQGQQIAAKALTVVQASDKPLAGGVFNTTPPALANGQTAPLQADAAGNLKVSSAAAASELHLGEVGGSATKISATFGPASSTTFTTGQVLMGTTAIAGIARVANGMGYLFGATLGLNAANTAQVDLVVFSSLPSGTYTAGATFTLVAADLPKVSKIIHLDDWTAVGAALSFGQPLDKGPRLFRCDDTTATQSLWVVAVARGSITLERDEISLEHIRR